MTRASNRAEEVAIAIKDLLSLALPGQTPQEDEARETKRVALSSLSPKQGLRHMLDSRSVQQLFSALPASQYVSRAIAAAYCDCSILTLERRLKRQYAEANHSWRITLSLPPPPLRCDHRGYLRWSFVQTFLAAWTKERDAAARPYRPKLRPAQRLMDALGRRFRFLQHADGSIESAWGQGGTTVADLIRILDARGTLALMTPMEALALPWANTAARAPWEDAVETLLASSQSVVAQGAALTRALALEAVAGKPSRATKRPRL